MKIFQLYFIFFSKLYVRFSKGKDDWYYMPLMIMSSLLGFNVFVFVSVFEKVNPYYIIGATIVCYIVLSFFFGRFAKNKEFVENFRLPKKTKILLILGICINISVIVKTMNYVREKRISEKPKQNYNYPSLKKYELENN